MASTMKQVPMESSVESSGWEAIDKKPKVMKSYKDAILDSQDTNDGIEVITEKTEPKSSVDIGVSSENWDSDETLQDEPSIGGDIKARTSKFDKELNYGGI